MQILNIKDIWQGGTAFIDARIHPLDGQSTADIWYRFEGLDKAPQQIADPFVTAMLPSCMLDQEPCGTDGTVSEMMHRNLPYAQEVLSGWYDYLEPVSVDDHRPEIELPVSQSGGVACCFSGGVDSWYSLITNLDRVTHLLLIRGFDIGLANTDLWRSSYENVIRIANSLGKRVIVCETNLRDVADRRRAKWGRPFNGDFWGECLHGAALASCVQPLGGTIGELIIPATHSYKQLKPWGSSPRLDRFWSNDWVKITHDGCEVDRLEKIREISKHDIALQTLRVCHNDTEALNCGHCEKCMRTKLALYLCGALDRAESFPGGNPFRKLHRMEVPGHLVHHYEALLDEANRNGDTNVARDVETVMGKRFSVERTLAQAVRKARRIGAAYESIGPDTVTGSGFSTKA